METDDAPPNPKMTRTIVKKTFTGALFGSSVAELLTCETESSGAGYLAMERVKGTLDGRAEASWNHVGVAGNDSFATQSGSCHGPAGMVTASPSVGSISMIAPR